MRNPTKIAIIGAGSAVFSAGIVRDLCVTPGLHGSHITLMDIDEHRLDMIECMATRLSNELKSGLTFSKTTSQEKALEGANFVINTALIGGHSGFEELRSLEEKHGYYRGVRMGNFKQIMFFLDVAHNIERICPDAWLIQSANPVFEGCTAMHRETDLKILGLCHGHYGYQKIATILGLDLQHVTAQCPGFNHWIWMIDFRYKGEDAYPILNEWIETKAESFWASDDGAFAANDLRKAAIHQYQLYGAMPIGDTPRMGGWWYHTDLETKQKWYGSLGGFDSEIGWAQYLKRNQKKQKTLKPLP